MELDVLTFGVMDVMIDGATNPGIAPNVFAIPCTVPAYLKKKKQTHEIINVHTARRRDRYRDRDRHRHRYR